MPAPSISSPHIPRDLRGELGRTGVLEFSGYVYEEALQALQLWRGQRIYREMADGDPTVGGVLFAIEQLVRQAAWHVEPAGKGAAFDDAAQLIDEALGDMSITWQDTLAEILSMLVFGWAYLEQVYKVRDGDNLDQQRHSKYHDGRIGWASWSIRAQETLMRWEFDPTGGILGLWQLPPPDYRLRFIPIEKSLLFRTTSRKGNPEGFSLLRRAYSAFYMKQNIQRIEAIGIERDAAGIPVVYIPPEIINTDAGQTYKDLVTNIRNDEQAGVVLPNVYDDSGHRLYELTLLNSGGSRQFNTDVAITRYRQDIAQALLADFMLLGQEGVGSYALSHDKTQLFQQALSTILDNISAVVNRFAIPRLLRLNGVDVSDGTPALKHSDITTPDIVQLGAYLQALTAAGIDVAGMADGKWLLETGGVPTVETRSGPDEPDVQKPGEDGQQALQKQQAPDEHAEPMQREEG